MKEKGQKEPHVPERLAETLEALQLLTPFLLIFGVFTLWPILQSFFLSLNSYDLFSPPQYVGNKNYAYLLGSPDFYKALSNTTFYTFGVVLVQTILAIALAVVLDQKIKAKGFFRVVFFLPSVTSSVAISLIFMFIFMKEDGMLNNMLSSAGIADAAAFLLGTAAPVDWLGNTHTALKAIMLQNIWTTSGYFMLIFLAGLQEIPTSLYEAARVDGATQVQAFMKITLPRLKPATCYVVTMGIIGCFQVFDQIYIMTAGGPLKSTLTVAYLLYTEAFQNFDMGYACSIAFVLATIIFVLTSVQKRFFEGED